jgi:hypothetical protein
MASRRTDLTERQRWPTLYRYIFHPINISLLHYDFADAYARRRSGETHARALRLSCGDRYVLGPLMNVLAECLSESKGAARRSPLCAGATGGLLATGFMREWLIRPVEA